MAFQKKMIIAFLVFVLVPIGVLGYISNQISTDVLQETISSQTVQTLKMLDQSMMAAVTEVNNFSDYMIASGDVQSFLTSSEKENFYELYTKQQAVAGVMYANAEIYQFALYNNLEENLYQSNSQVLQEESMFSQQLLLEMKKVRGEPVWQSPSTIASHPFQQKTPLVFTNGRVVNDIDTLEPLGYMVLLIQLDLFDQVFSQASSTVSTELLINKEGKILYALDDQWIGKKLTVESLQEVQSGETGYLLDQWNGERQLITYMPSQFKLLENEAVWLVSLKSWDLLSNDITYIRNTTLWSALLALLAAVFFNFFYLRRTARFVQTLQDNMKQVETGDLSVRMRTYNLRELNQLSFRFNQMVHRLSELIVQIKKEEEKSRIAQFKVLQQQINPHFLYNTLESINALAAMSGQKDISKMTINLGRLLRISINGSYEVFVQREINHVISYLEIQKIRFDNFFTYEIEVNEELNQKRVLKLILQPLVENILTHAFTEHQENGLISIHGKCIDGRGYFYIKDNGEGISEASLKKILQKRADFEEQGHGIRNVHERLQLFYGKSYGMMICSSEQGTIIRLSFPLNRGEEDNV